MNMFVYNVYMLSLTISLKKNYPNYHFKLPYQYRIKLEMSFSRKIASPQKFKKHLGCNLSSVFRPSKRYLALLYFVSWLVTSIFVLHHLTAQQQDLIKLEHWEKTWEMHFNPSKCQVMHVCKSPNLIKTQYVLHGQVLEAVEHAKYFGLDIGNKLNWNHHIQNVTTKSNKTLGYLRRNIRTKHKGIRQTAYQTLVRPQVEYASPVWSPHIDKNINKVEAVQRGAARWVTHDYSSNSSVTQMINTLGWRSCRCPAHNVL